MKAKLGELAQNFYRPDWWTDTALPYAYEEAIRTYYDFVSPSGISLMDQDWDNLILLDACRWDLFTESNTLEGRLEAKYSKGSTTREFLLDNFAGKTFFDTVYVTASPVYQRIDLDSIFHETVDVWDGNWDSEFKTVLPEDMRRATKEAHERYPNKRILSHFMQPHYPFIGKTAEDIGDHAGYELAYRAVKGKEKTRDAPTVWDLLEQGRVKRDVVWRAYKENLEVALPHVEELINDFPEKTVVTSDHGNMLGELATPFPKRYYGHPWGVRTDELVKIPWLVIDGEHRKDITSEPPVSEREQANSEKVTQRLADLGYTDM